MKKEILNGTPIPYDLSVDTLKEMISSPMMKDFALACEALSYKNEPEAYQIMKSYLHDKDKYRRLYILKTIFRYSEAVELVDDLEKAIASTDFLFIENGLLIVSEYNIKISEALLLSVVQKYCDQLYTAVGALKILAIIHNNFERIAEIFAICSKCAQKEILGEILCKAYLPEKAKPLFALFAKDSFGCIRLIGLKIGKQYGFDTTPFLTDSDGHFRKAVKL